jgi:DNA polymerase-3 subunit beta
MKLIILKNNLKEGLSVVERAVTESGNLPVLKNISFKTEDGKIKISATNLELGITSFISGKINQEGGVTIPFSAFYNIIANTDSERVSIEVEKNNIVVKNDNYQARIQGISIEEFPIIPKIENPTNSLEINSTILKEALLQVVNAVQFSEIRPEISGILFDFQITTLKLVGTDSFRLAEKTINNKQFSTTSDKGFRVIVPLKTVQEIIRIFPENNSVTVIIDPHQILFKNESIELISRLINGQYPDYEQIIPKAIETELIIEKNKFLSAVKLVSSFSGKTNDIKIRVKEGSKAVEIYSSNQYIGENNYLIPARIKGGDFKEISFNWRYLVDGIKLMSSDQILFGVNGDTKPGILKSPEDTTYFYILMPIKAS